MSAADDAPEPPARSDSLPSRFFDEARSVFVGDREQLDFKIQDILAIAESPALRSQFRQSYRAAVQNPELGLLIKQLLEDIAIDLDDKAKVTDIKVDLLDRAGLAVAASVTAAGIAAIVATGGALGPIVLLTGGLLGMGSAGAGRTVLKLSSQRDLSAAQKIRRLVSTL